MRKRFTFAREDQPGQDWLARFRAGWGEAWRWYLGEGRAAPPSAAGKCWRQTFDHFAPGEYTHDHGELVSERTG